MKKLKKMIILLCASALFLLFSVTLTGCKVKIRDDSEVYSCYYYTADGEDIISKIVSYTLELRTDGVLITRYKTKNNSDSGRNDYRIEGDYLILTAYYGTKKYDIAGNEIIMGEYVEDSYILAKFRLTQTAKPQTADIYSCVYRALGENDVTADLRYCIASFDRDGKFALYFKSKDKRESFAGTFIKNGNGYIATENSNEDAETENETVREWRFKFSGEELILEEETDDNICISKFVKTQSAESE